VVPMMNNPALIFVLTLGLMWAAARLGKFFGKKKSVDEVASDEYGIVLSATLTCSPRWRSGRRIGTQPRIGV
jgi:hypothetical protein